MSTVEAEIVQEQPAESMAVARIESGAPGILRPADSLDAIAEAFKEYQAVCERILTGEDYQEYQGVSRKKKSAWRKLATAFNVSSTIVGQDVIRTDSRHVLSASFTVRAFTGRQDNPSRQVEAVGFCDVTEKCCDASKGEKCHKANWKSHYCCKKDCDGRRHWSHPDHDVIATAQTRATNRAIADLIGCGEVSAEELGDDSAAPRESKGGGRRATGGGKAPPEPSVQRAGGEFDEGGLFETAGQQKPVGKPPGRPFPTYDSLKKMIAELNAGPGCTNEEIVTEYFRTLDNPAGLLPNEALVELDLRFVPGTASEMRKLAAAITEFQLTKVAKWPYAPHVPADPKQVTKAKPSTPKPVTVPREHKAPGTDLPPELADEIVPIPRKGMKLNDYLKDPDTIGTLYAARHDDAAARARLFGFMHNFQPAGFNGRPPKDSDVRFRDVLDQLAAWYEENHPEEVSDA